MKIEELSIGDWVVAKLAKWDYDSPEETEPMRIRCIDNSDRKRAYTDLEFGGGQYSTSAHIEDLRPIPLTPEILEKNGCLHTAENRTLCDWFDGRITVRKYNNREWYELFVGSNQMKFKLMFVHQLQHALRLAGIEKEIEL